jgi:hypothetical protein
MPRPPTELREGNPVARHWLIVTRDPDPNFDDADLDVIHEGCPSKVTIRTAGEEDVRFLGVGDGDRNTEYTEHLCQVQAEIDEVGLSGALGNSEVDVDQLRPGRYEIEAWNTYYPAVPGLHGPEWDGGIRLVEPSPVDLVALLWQPPTPRRPVPGSPHWVVVPDDPDEADSVVEHSPGCPSLVVLYLPGEDLPVNARPETETVYLCEVGARLWGNHIADLLDVEDLPPGRHEIEAWSEQYPELLDGGGEHWDGGLRVVDPPEETEEPVG